MFKVTLINLPFASVALPSLALMQIQAMTERLCPRDTRVRLVHANLEFARWFGLELYSMVSDSLEANMTGLGEWFFRQSAFPSLPDNEAAYFKRFFRAPGAAIPSRRQAISDKRRDVDRYLSDLIDAHRLDEEDVVGCTSMFCQNVAVFALTRHLKARNPRVVTAMGGANCEFPMGAAIAQNIGTVDYVFSGPALKSFPELLTKLRGGDAGTCHAIAGVFSKRNTSARVGPGTHASAHATVAPVGEETDINETAPLDYTSFLDALDTTFGRGAVVPRLTFETSRGCWWGARAHCTFCGLNGQTMAFRALSADRAIRLFDDLFGWSDRCPAFQAVDNIMPKNYISDVLPKLNPPANVSIFYEVKADLTREQLGILARARVREIQPGIEALATSTLKLMKKGTSAFQNLTFLKSCLAEQIDPAWNLLIGFPGETEAVYEKYVRDLPLLVHLPPPSGVFPVRFDRFSPYFTRAHEYGLRLYPNEWYSYVYPFDGAVLSELAYFFVNADFEAPYLTATATYINRLEARVAAWRNRWGKQKTAPRLFLEYDGDAPTVIDTRFDATRRHRLGAEHRRLLEFLEQPKSLADVRHEFGAPLVSWAITNGLVFEEQERLLSLVVTSSGVAPASLHTLTQSVAC